MKWNAEAINNALWSLHLNITDGAKMLGMSREHMARLLKGDPEPSPPVQRLLDAYMAGYRPADWIGKEGGRKYACSGCGQVMVIDDGDGLEIDLADHSVGETVNG